ncbi:MULTISPECIES: hypothetical protein [Pandoraea]|uniref:Transmembrane protein n=1 Tax=Pandoraea nosoerga TaxID=2508296 RepID=A0A5E4SBR6_9BURK|nr:MULTISPECIES: hypothetical protein [Pandoraea]VVD72024.1 hypothetical protein PNO31109_00625 [Pandoraea nosoerga]
MFIVILGWLYVMAMVAITAPSVWLGLLIFAGGGIAPALLWLYIAGSRIRRIRSAQALRRDAAAPADAALHGAAPGTGPTSDASE